MENIGTYICFLEDKAKTATEDIVWHNIEVNIRDNFRLNICRELIKTDLKKGNVKRTVYHFVQENLKK